MSLYSEYEVYPSFYDEIISDCVDSFRIDYLDDDYIFWEDYNNRMEEEALDWFIRTYAPKNEEGL